MNECIKAISGLSTRLGYDRHIAHLKLPLWPILHKTGNHLWGFSFLCEWDFSMFWGSGLAFGLRESCPHSWAQYAWGSGPWPRPSIRLSSFAKLQGTTHYGVILLIGPLSSPPHSCRVPPYSVRMEYACKPPPWNCCTRALPHSPMWKLRLGNIVLSS